TAVFAANAAIRRKAAADRNIADMGSTCVAARFCLETRELFIAHVGDSRAYRLRAGRLEQLTTDHTMAELGVTGGRAQHLSRALGTEACPKLDVLLARFELDDIFLLCCDGLTKMVGDAALTQVLTGASSPTVAVTDLVARANTQGGQDNITAVVVAVTRRG
ncbi:MAG TPA: SpoIIE family protein phosphatase, partial [Labilithrix sp.]|nr:SpoIIE family protein phosphatase [Labilithrix sp.]